MARKTEYSRTSELPWGGSQVREAPPSAFLDIFIADGGAGKPGTQVLKLATSPQGPRPQALTPQTLNL